MTQNKTCRWGIVSTVKAEPTAIEEFAAHHLDLGAHRVFLYFDDASTTPPKTLIDHPKVRIVSTDERYWKACGKPRPKRHQPRQSANATHAYQRSKDIEWLAHIDVDEFLWPKRALSDTLCDLGPDCHVARVRPAEMLSPVGAEDATLFKAFSLPRPQRMRQTREIYPTFGDWLNGGFLSHVAGKVFVRTGATHDVELRIHNAFFDGEMNPGMQPLEDVTLCHLHAKSWEDWNEHFRFRLQKGAYRAELSPNLPRDAGGETLHDMLSRLSQEKGEAGLRAFYEEVCTATPELCARLNRHGLLREIDLGLAEKRRRIFAIDAD